MWQIANVTTSLVLNSQLCSTQHSEVTSYDGASSKAALDVEAELSKVADAERVGDWNLGFHSWF